MGYYNIMTVVILFIMNKPLEKRKVVIVNIKINRGHFAQRGHKRIVNNLFVRTQFIEKQEYLQMLSNFGILYKIAFAGHRAKDADLLQVFVPFSAVSLDISNSKLSSLIDGSSSSFRILPSPIALIIAELVSCRYFGVAE